MTRQKYHDYPELLASDRVRFVVLACEEGGRWGPDVHEVVSDLVRLTERRRREGSVKAIVNRIGE